MEGVTRELHQKKVRGNVAGNMFVFTNCLAESGRGSQYRGGSGDRQEVWVWQEVGALQGESESKELEGRERSLTGM